MKTITKRQSPLTNPNETLAWALYFYKNKFLNIFFHTCHESEKLRLYIVNKEIIGERENTREKFFFKQKVNVGCRPWHRNITKLAFNFYSQRIKSVYTRLRYRTFYLTFQWRCVQNVDNNFLSDEQYFWKMFLKSRACVFELLINTRFFRHAWEYIEEKIFFIN